MLVNLVLQADSGLRSTTPSQGNQKFDFGAFLKGELPKKLLIMLVGTHQSCLHLNLCRDWPLRQLGCSTIFITAEQQTGVQGKALCCYHVDQLLRSTSYS